MFGYKRRKIQFKNEYTIAELYDIIKDIGFEAGEPRIAPNHFCDAIVFPALNEMNQVAIYPYNFGSDSKNSLYMVAKQEEGNCEHTRWDGDTSTDMSGIFGKTKKRCEKLVDSTYATLEALEL